MCTTTSAYPPPPRLARIRAIRAAISSCIDIPLPPAAPPPADTRPGALLVPFDPLDRLSSVVPLDVLPSMTGALLSTVCTLRSPPLPNADISPSSAERPPPAPPAAALGGGLGAALKEGADGGPGGGGAAAEEKAGAGGGGAGGAALVVIGGGTGGGAAEDVDDRRGGGGGAADRVTAGGGGG